MRLRWLTILTALVYGWLAGAVLMALTPVTWNGSSCPAGAAVVTPSVVGLDGVWMEYPPFSVTLPSNAVTWNAPKDGTVYARTLVGGVARFSSPFTVGGTPAPSPTPTPTITPTPTPTVTPTPQQWAIVKPLANAILRQSFVLEVSGPLGFRVEVQRPDRTQALEVGVFTGASPALTRTVDVSALPSGAYVIALKTSFNQSPPQVSVPVTIDNAPVVTPTPTPTPTVTVAMSVKTCGVTLSGAAPDSTAGWSVQFKRDANVNVGTIDATAPFSRTTTLNAGSYQFYAVWMKNGVAITFTPQVSGVCK